MSLLFPAVQGAFDAAKKAQAKNDAMQIATAIVAYDTEYGRLQDTNSPQTVSGNVLGALTGSNTTLNPRKIVFLEVLNYKKGKGGIDATGRFVDPWAHPYYVALDGDYDNRVGVSTNGAATSDATIMKKVGVWNTNANSRQRVRSWD